MKTAGFIVTALLAWVLIASALIGTAVPEEEGFTLIRTVPNDVFLCISERHNPERAFIDRYWGDVLQALEECGIHEDVIEFFGSLMGRLDERQAAEVERIKDRALELVNAVDWEDLAAKEFLFAERFIPPNPISDDNPPILTPSMVWIFRGSLDGAARNYEGLTAILDALAEEVNKITGVPALAVERSRRMGVEVVSVDLMKQVPGNASIPLAIALREDILIMGMRENLFEDVLALMDGRGVKKALGDDPRFKAAFAKLPPAEDLMTFFDMQALLKPMRVTADRIIDAVSGPRDCYLNSSMPAEVNGLNGKAMSAYRSGDIREALKLTRKAHEVAPGNSVILYNMACFTARAGDRDEALAWLARAVDGGFYAPRKIAGDADLQSLHGEPKYEVLLAKAAEMATKCNAKDVAVHFAEEGEVYRLRMQVNQTYETKDYEQGLKLIQQACAIDPKDSKVLYTMACLHTLLGHEAEGLDYLEQAVEAGFYCPAHMSKDPDLESVRGHQRFKAAVARAKDLAGQAAVRMQAKTEAMAKRIADRLMNAAGIFDYSAAVEYTDGYTTTAETISALVPDAKERPLYPVFGHQPPLSAFERYLPEETVSFSMSGGIDLSALYAFIEDLIRLGGEPGEEVLAKWGGIQEMLGLDFRKDVIGWIQGDSISVTMEDGGSVTFIKVHDEDAAREKVSAVIEFGTTKLGELVRKKREFAGLAMLGLRTSPVRHPELEGFQNIHFAMVPQPAVWGVRDGHLIFGSSAEAIVLCLSTARGDHPNIRSNERAMKEMIVPDGPFAGLSLSDMRGLGQELEQVLSIATMVSGMMSAFIPEPAARQVIAKISGMLGKLTPVVRKIDFYKSSASLITSDGLTWHSRSVTHYFSPEERAAREM